MHAGEARQGKRNRTTMMPGTQEEGRHMERVLKNSAPEMIEHLAGKTCRNKINGGGKAPTNITATAHQGLPAVISP